jgi:hypothetical protein
MDWHDNSAVLQQSWVSGFVGVGSIFLRFILLEVDLLADLIGGNLTSSRVFDELIVEFMAFSFGKELDPV